MTLFITGAESFIGRALRARCDAVGQEWMGIDSAGSAVQGIHKADIRDPAIADLVPEGAIVVHLAAISRDPDCRADPRTAFDVNVTGTLNLATAAQKRGARQFFFASSEWVYGGVHNNETQREDQPIDVTAMTSEYALSKIVAEQCLKLSFQIPAITILRFGIVYGPRPANWSAVESLFNSVLTKDEVKVGALSTARRFIHVDDIVSGMLASRGRTGFEIFNLSFDRLISLGEVIEASVKICGRRPKIVETNPSQISIRNPDNGKARAELGWAPVVGLDAGLKTLANFFTVKPHKAQKKN
jgi:nucleoside-diphosphate-sugar epimerase